MRLISNIMMKVKAVYRLGVFILAVGVVVSPLNVIEKVEASRAVTAGEDKYK